MWKCKVGPSSGKGKAISARLQVPLLACLVVLPVASACGAFPIGQGPGNQTASAVRSTSPSPTPACANSAPSHRAGASAAYDGARKATVMFGGLGNPPNTLNETWLFDGTCWQPVHPSISPAPRFGAAMAFDPVIRRTLLVGGRTQIAGQPDYPEDAWSWDGTAWALLSGAPHLDFPFASFDPVHRVVVIFGSGSAGRPQTWTWDGATWLQITPSRSPSVDSQSAMCFDQSTSKVLLYGGVSESVNGGVSSATWLWDGAEWSQVSPTHNPGPRFDHLLACGPQTVLFGGLTNQAASVGTGTWLWDGIDWQLATTTQAPDDCCGVVIYDGGRYVVFETGHDSIPLWQWTGSDWSKVS
jgi:hypothetical protein